MGKTPDNLTGYGYYGSVKSLEKAARKRMAEGRDPTGEAVLVRGSDGKLLRVRHTSGRVLFGSGKIGESTSARVFSGGEVKVLDGLY